MPVYGTQPIPPPTRILGGDRTFGGQSFDWTSFDPSRWWQTPGLEQSWFQESPAGWGLAAPGRDLLGLDPGSYPGITGPGGRFDPWETYQDYWGQGEEWQAALDAPFGGGGSEMTVRGRGGKGRGEPMWGPFDPIELPGIPEEDQARFQQWIDEISGMLQARLEPGYSIWDPELTARMEERASPEYTAWSPEQRGALEENIGGQLALAKRGIAETMAQRGIRGSGLEAQLGMTAAGQAARGMGDVRAALSASDETTRTAALDRLTQMQAADEASRQWATQQLEGVREFGLTGLQGQTADMQNMLLDFARMTGMPVMLGPEEQLLDPFGLTEAGMSWEDYQNALLMSYLTGDKGGDLADILSLAGGMGNIDNPFLQLILGGAGMGAMGG